MTTVTDTDRNAVTAYLILTGAPPEWCEVVTMGQGDDELILQAFARHREQAILEGMEIMREHVIIDFTDCDELDVAGIVRAYDPAAILEAHTRAKATASPSLPTSPDHPSNPATAASSS
jgi:asparagine synthetase B (glutamine-hydrolysing)